MSATTQRLNLVVTNSSESETIVTEWIDGLTGYGQPSQSNMEKIDDAFGLLDDELKEHTEDEQIHVTGTNKNNWNDKANLVRGYYDGISFYVDSGHQSIITPVISSAYVDLTGGGNYLYVWDANTSSYVAVSSPSTLLDCGTWG